MDIRWQSERLKRVVYAYHISGREAIRKFVVISNLTRKSCFRGCSKHNPFASHCRVSTVELGSFGASKLR